MLILFGLFGLVIDLTVSEYLVPELSEDVVCEFETKESDWALELEQERVSETTASWSTVSKLVSGGSFFEILGLAVRMFWFAFHFFPMVT